MWLFKTPADFEISRGFVLSWTMLKIAIIGAGGTGSATARFLAQAGHQVTVYEKFYLDHDQGSSYGGSRIIRRTYPDPLYTQMMGLAYPLWEELERETEANLFLRCGGLTFGRYDNPEMAQTEYALKVNDVPYKTLTAAEVHKRFPAFDLDEDQYAIYVTDGGLLRASQCVTAQMRLAISAGAELREGAQVTQIAPVSNGLRVWDGDRPEDYDRVVVAAGPWMNDLLPVQLPLTVTRQPYIHLLPSAHPEQFSSNVFPVWIDTDTYLYGFPQHDELPGVKLAAHHEGQPTTADTVQRDVTDQDRHLLRDYAARRFPDLTGPDVHEKVCLYTRTSSEDFIIDAVPGWPGAYLCSGCSGHGFKFTVLLGQILAQLAQDLPPPCDLSRFRLSNFI